MKLYVCWNVKRGLWAIRAGDACHALRDAGHAPEVIKSYGLRVLPDLFNRSEGRREAKRLTGSKTVPVLVTDEGEVVSDSKEASPGRASIPRAVGRSRRRWGAVIMRLGAWCTMVR